VGVLWLGLSYPRDDSVWIYDIEVDAEHRGKGFGRLLLAAAEEEARRAGATAMGLQVFGANAVARGLYESAGYEPVSIVMRKPLDH
jgi:ribosomal protein S18 acetylase RimI-like enzyme